MSQCICTKIPQYSYLLRSFIVATVGKLNSDTSAMSDGVFQVVQSRRPPPVGSVISLHPLHHSDIMPARISSSSSASQAQPDRRRHRARDEEDSDDDDREARNAASEEEAEATSRAGLTEEVWLICPHTAAAQERGVTDA